MSANKELVLVDDLLRRVNTLFERHRHSHQDTSACVHASYESSRYIAAFWSHFDAAVKADPSGLGMRATRLINGQQQQLTLEDIYRNVTEGGPPPGEDREFRRVAGILAPLIMSDAVLNSATQSFAESFQQRREQSLPYDVDVTKFVSLRTLLPLRHDDSHVGANAPSLVMGGTSTAVKMCWNLLLRAPRALFELNGVEATRADVEKVWLDTRELIFRIGSGSLAAFVSLASACSENPNAMLWQAIDDLSLTKSENQYLWCANSALVDRFSSYLEQVRDSQQGHYVGCAALYTRVKKLKLRESGLSDSDDTTAFAEILRWISLVADDQYFPLFD